MKNIVLMIVAETDYEYHPCGIKNTTQQELKYHFKKGRFEPVFLVNFQRLAHDVPQ